MARFNMKQFNLDIDRLKLMGLTPRTEMAVSQTIYNQIVGEVGTKQSGYILTYREATTRLKRKGLLQGYFTYDYYKGLRNALIGELKEKGELTYSSTLQTRRGTYESEIRENLGYVEGLSDIPFEDLRDILNEAWTQTKDDIDGSATFAEHLRQVLFDYGYQ